VCERVCVGACVWVRVCVCVCVCVCVLRERGAQCFAHETQDCASSDERERQVEMLTFQSSLFHRRNSETNSKNQRCRNFEIPKIWPLILTPRKMLVIIIYYLIMNINSSNFC
jgi:hypothetical protein